MKTYKTWSYYTFIEIGLRNNNNKERNVLVNIMYIFQYEYISCVA